MLDISRVGRNINITWQRSFKGNLLNLQEIAGGADYSRIILSMVENYFISFVFAFILDTPVLLTFLNISPLQTVKFWLPFLCQW